MTTDKIRPYAKTGIKKPTDSADYQREYWRQYRRGRPEERRHTK